MDIADVVAAAEAADVSLVRFEYCDLGGVTRCKTATLSDLATKMVEGITLTRAMGAMSMLDELSLVEGMEPVGEVRMVPDPGTFSVLPWVPGSASMMVDLLDHDRTQWGGCARSYLQRMVADAAELGIRVHAAFESEYYLAREVEGGYEPADAPGHAPCFSAIGLDNLAAVRLDTVRGLEGQGIVVESAINEYGPGQQEVVTRHAEALAAADQQMKVRDTARGVATAHGLVASFAPKPFPDQIGSGAHIHFSLWEKDGGRNLLWDPRSEGNLSELGRHFIAGVLDHLPALVALTAPSYNSYRRLTPGAWASASTAWGFDNKEASLRVIAPFFGREEQSFNVEFKPSDSSANPYLALGALIASGLDGVRRGIALGAPAEHDPARLSEAERERLGIHPLPTSMMQALDALEADECLLGSLGDLMARAYVTVRRSEEAAFSARDLDFEIAQHFHRF